MAAAVAGQKVMSRKSSTSRRSRDASACLVLLSGCELALGWLSLPSSPLAAPEWSHRLCSLLQDQALEHGDDSVQGRLPTNADKITSNLMSLLQHLWRGADGLLLILLVVHLSSQHENLSPAWGLKPTEISSIQLVCLLSGHKTSRRNSPMPRGSARVHM